MPMPTKEILIKTTGAIHMTASRSLSLVERKISNIFLKNAYDNLVKKDEHKIKINELIKSLGWDTRKNYNDIKLAIKKLVDTTLEFNSFGKDKINEWYVCSLLAEAQFVELVILGVLFNWVSRELPPTQLHSKGL